METKRQSKLSRSAAKRLVRARRSLRRAGRAVGGGSGLLQALVVALLFGAIIGVSHLASPNEGATDAQATPQSRVSAERVTSADNSGAAAAQAGGEDAKVTAAAPVEVAAAGPAFADAPPPVIAKDATAIGAAQPATPSAKTSEPAPAPATAAAETAPPHPPGPVFRDERALIPAAAATAVPAAAATAATPGFRDERPLTAPSFKDPRPVAAPSFRDPRPTSPATFRDDRPLTADAAAQAGKPEESQKEAEPKPFEVGYFLDDRSPMVRSQTPEEVAATAGQDAAAPPAPAQSEAANTTPVAATTSGSSEPASAAPATSQSPASSAAQALSDGSETTLVALAPGQIKIDSASCSAPEITTEALDGGMMRMHIAAACHPNEFVQISYGGAEFIRKLNAYGALDYTLDCFAGTSSAVEVRFADGNTRSLPVVANDLDKVSKIAVTWRSGVNLDLHVFEYAAKLNEYGHYWARSPSSLISAQVQGQADGRGHGFLSSMDDDKSLGDKIEVYTFFHNDQQTSGSISLALDNESRGETPSGANCGQGALAEIAFQVSILPRRGQVSRQSGVLTRVECGTKLTQEARFNPASMPGLRIRK